MKKILPFILLLLALSSCSEDVRFNNEAVFQGVVDNNFWKGGNAVANLDLDNKLTIKAGTFIDQIALEIPVPPTGTINPRNEDTFVTYVLGTSNARKAYYTLKKAGNVYEYETAIGVGDGQIVISEYDGATVSGTFEFNAKNTDPDSEANETVNLQKGVFYKVPVRK